MSWSASVNTQATPVADAIEAARQQAHAGVANQDEATRTVAEDVIEEQLGLIEGVAVLAGTSAWVSASLYGHLNVDGSGTLGVSATITKRSATT